MPLPISRFEFKGGDPAPLAERVRALAPGLDEVSERVREIVDAVRERGDRALREFSRELDGVTSPRESRVDRREIAAAEDDLDPEVLDALQVAARHIAAVAEAELGVTGARAYGGSGADSVRALDPGMGQRVRIHERPVAAAGVYAPAGRAPLLSSVLMCALPARVAGVGRIVVATPPSPDGTVNEGVLAACAVAGVSEVYAIGGAQAIAALAFGTETIKPVDVIAGPGNRYVTEAKRLVSGSVKIDGIAGPSELAVVADQTANPRWIALDLCAQAEHGPDSLVVLIASRRAVIDAVLREISELQGRRATVTDAPLAVVQTRSIREGLRFADALAPEHLQLAVEGADDLAENRIAGAIFCGTLGATAFGDYAAGSNHVLPTGGAARFGGPLGARTFLRSTTIVSFTPESVRRLAPHVAALANAEGLPVHGESVTARAENMDPPTPLPD